MAKSRQDFWRWIILCRNSPACRWLRPNLPLELLVREDRPTNQRASDLVWVMSVTARTPDEQYRVALAYWGRGSNNFPLCGPAGRLARAKRRLTIL